MAEQLSDYSPEVDSGNDEDTYRVELEGFSGPLDLLLYLIRREEVDIYDIPVARITEQYLHYMGLMSELNINVAGEFIVMAATLIEIKSRMMTPQPVAADEEDPEDPRFELVRQLMEYKRFKEAAMALNDRAEDRAQRFARPGEHIGPITQQQGAPKDLTVWALLEAFSRVLEQTGRRGPHRVVMDEIPQAELQSNLEIKMRTVGRVSFKELFEDAPSRSILVGTFLALLELVRQQAIRVEQVDLFGEIYMTYVPPEAREVVLPPPEEAPADDTLAPAPVELSSGDEDDDYFDDDDEDEYDEDEDEDEDASEVPENLDSIELPEVPEMGDDAISGVTPEAGESPDAPDVPREPSGS